MENEKECEFRDLCDECTDDCKEFIKLFNKRIEEDKHSMLTENDGKFLKKLIENCNK